MKNFIVNLLSLSKRYSILDARELKKVSISSREILREDFVNSLNHLHFVSLITDTATRLFFKIPLHLLNPANVTWYFVDSLEMAMTKIEQHRSGELPVKQLPSQSPATKKIPRLKKDMVLYIEELLQEREREKTIREQMLDRLLSIISRISRDTPQ
ncbi:MAG: hypothetical protein GY757_39100, partial [bacterium]|nr:hypothetical protein [bacterium]